MELDLTNSRHAAEEQHTSNSCYDWRGDGEKNNETEFEGPGARRILLAFVPRLIRDFTGEKWVLFYCGGLHKV